jgi:hypothetical protein
MCRQISLAQQATFGQVTETTPFIESPREVEIFLNFASRLRNPLKLRKNEGFVDSLHQSGLNVVLIDLGHHIQLIAS